MRLKHSPEYATYAWLGRFLPDEKIRTHASNYRRLNMDEPCTHGSNPGARTTKKSERTVLKVVAGGHFLAARTVQGMVGGSSGWGGFKILLNTRAHRARIQELK